jgi:hypothetical protein
VADVAGAAGDVEAAAAELRRGLEAAMTLPAIGETQLCSGLSDDWTWVALIGRLVSRAISAIVEPGGGSGEAIDELQLGPVIAVIFRDLGLDEGGAWRLVALIRMLRQLPMPSSVAGLAAAERAPALVRALIADESVRPYIRVNVWEGISWFNRESFGQVLWWMAALDTLDAAERVGVASPGAPARKKPAARAASSAAARGSAAGKSVVTDRLRAAERLTAALSKAARRAGYQLDKLEDAARG